MSKKKAHDHEATVDVEKLITKTKDFYVKYKNIPLVFYSSLAAIVILGIIAVYTLVYVPGLEEEAKNELFIAEQYFEKDSFNIALEGVVMGDEVIYSGFLTIIDEYGPTRSANLAKYYAGLCYMHLGDYESAIDYLKDFKGKDKLVPANSLGIIGDAYVELEDYENAIKYYIKAAEESNNDFTAPIYLRKAGIVYEKLEDYENALKMYERIKYEHPESEISENEIDALIAGVDVKIPVK